MANIYPIKTVYLAGPITGLSYGAARQGWREEMKKLLPDHVHPMSPMRGKDFLLDEIALTSSNRIKIGFCNPLR